MMKKILKKVTVVAMAAMMVMAMGVTAFAAEDESTERGAYDVNVDVTMPVGHGNPFEGADIDYKGDNTEITIYTDVIQAATSGGVVVTGYVDSLEIDGAEFIGDTTDDEGYPDSFTFLYNGIYDPAKDGELTIDFNITIENSDMVHRITEAHISFTAR